MLFAFILIGCGRVGITGLPAATIAALTKIPNTATLPLPAITPGPNTPTLTPDPTLQVVATLYKQTQVANDLSAQATQRAMDGFRKTFNGMCENIDLQTSLSPDGKWLAQDCPLDRFQVIRKDNSVVWAVKYEQIFESIEGAGAIFPVHWANDGSYLYFTQVGCCADNDSMRTGNMLYRMDLGTGEWKMIVSGYFNHYSFSPTGRRLLYILNDQASTGKPLVVHILDLNPGTEKKIEFSDFEQAGYVLWKEDGTRLVMTAKTGNVFEGNQLFSIIEIDIKEDSSRVIIQKSRDIAKVIDWSATDVLTIEKYSYPGTGDQYYSIAEHSYFELNTNAFITATVSP